MSKSMISIPEAVDRISTLPDGVICHILSFLPTKIVVSMSALSTRWRYLFVSVTGLHFYDSNDNSGRKFSDLVHRVKNRQDIPDFSLFKLNVSLGCYDISDVNSWIYSAICRNVPKIMVTVHNLKIGDVVRARSLVSDLFTYKALVDLSLYGSFDLSVPESVYLPNLKTCCFMGTGIRFIDDGSTQRFFSSCPKLEKLTFSGCHMREVKELELNIPSLKKLNIFMVRGNFLLNVPNLEYFEWSCRSASFLCKGVWKSIGRANIGIEKHYGVIEENMSQLVNNLIEVKSLSLCRKSMELLQSSCGLLPMFNSLTHLELKSDTKAGWKLLSNLLHKTPFLEVLVIHGEFMDDYIHAEITKSEPFCLSQQLKVVKVYASSRDLVELKWIKLLLRIASVLEKLTVYSKSGYQIEEELLSVPRVSKTCQVEIVEQNENFNYEHAF